MLLGLDSAKSLDALVTRGHRLYDYAKAVEINIPVRQPVRTVRECLDLLSKILPEIDYDKEVRSYHFNYPYECAKLAVDLLGKAIQRIIDRGLYRRRWGDVVALKDVIDLYLEAQRLADAYQLLKSMDILTAEHENIIIRIIHNVWQALQTLSWLVTPAISIRTEDWLSVRTWARLDIRYGIVAESSIRLEDVAMVGRLWMLTASDTLPITSYSIVVTGFTDSDSGKGREIHWVSVAVPVISSSTIMLEDAARVAYVVSIVASDMISISSSATLSISYTVNVIDVGRVAEAFKTSIIVSIASTSSISLADTASAVAIRAISVSDYLSISTLASPSLMYTLILSDRSAGTEVYALRRIVGDAGAGRELYNISIKVNVIASSSIGLSDVATAVAIRLISVAESLVISASSLPSITYSITVVDRASGADVHSLRARVTVADLSRGLDVFSLTSMRSVADAGRGMEAYTIAMRISVSAASNIMLSDIASAIAIRNIPVSDALGISSIATLSVSISRISSDRGAGREAYGVTRRTAVSASSSLSFVDSAHISVSRRITASDSLTVTTLARISIT
jgi:hypothetical protein